MTYKCIALDMDGTLLTDSKQVSVANREALLKAIDNGIVVIFATGRSVSQARPFAEQIGIHPPIVANNGGHNWLKPDDLLSEYILDTCWVNRLYEVARRYSIRYWGHGKQGSYYSDREGDVFPPLHQVDWFQFAIESQDMELVSRMHQEASNWHEVEVSRAAPNQLEINPKGISKASGIAEVCSQLQIGMNEVVAIGDGMNDLAMLRAVGLGIAMENAEEQVKKAAVWVTPSNEEDGVAQALRRVFGF